MSHSRHDDTVDHVDLLDRLQSLDPPRLRGLTLVHLGPDADQADYTWRLEGSVCVGRDPGPQGIELQDPGASRRHIELVFDAAADSYSIKDLGSRNGTYVNGAKTEQSELHHGAVIRISESIFVFADVELPEGLRAPTPEPDVSLVRSLAELRADLAAPSGLSVLILGPTGSGKEIMAKRIHAASGRAGRMVSVNCGALNRELIASELFGHSAGAFSGASGARPGLFASADKGTLFLDEIADLPLDQQPTLLRTIQEKMVRPVGSDTEVQIDVRIIAATHQDLPKLVEAEAFRADLYARLSGFVVELPGLNGRREEVLPFFVELSGVAPDRMSADAAEALLLHPWPLNIREVQHLGARVKLYQQGRPLELADLPPEFSERLTRLRREPVAPTIPAQMDRDGLEALLVAHEGNVATISKLLGKHRAQVYRWLRREGLEPEDYRPA